MRKTAIPSIRTEQWSDPQSLSRILPPFFKRLADQLEEDARTIESLEQRLMALSSQVAALEDDTA